MSLEDIVVLLTELGFGPSGPREERRAGDADEIGDGTICVAGKAKFSYAAGIWEQLIKAFQKLFEDDAVSYDGVEVGAFIRSDVAQNLLLIFKREVISGSVVSA